MGEDTEGAPLQNGRMTLLALTALLPALPPVLPESPPAILPPPSTGSFQGGNGLQKPGAGPDRKDAKTPAEEEGARVAGALLDRISGGDRDTLTGVSLKLLRSVRRKDPNTGKADWRPIALWEVSLSYPNRIRMVWKEDGKTPTVLLSDGRKAWVGPGGGPFVEARGEGLADLRARLLLFGSLAGWDLLHGSPRLRDGLLESRFASLPDAPLVKRRVAGDTGRCSVLILGNREFRLEGEIETTGGKSCRLLTSKGERFEIQRFGTDFSFLKKHFDPRRSETSRAMILGREDRNFRVPVLARLPACKQIALRDPGSWPERLKLLDKVGRRLFELGMEPTCLPLYRDDGAILIQFRPDRRGRKVPAEGPEGTRIEDRPERLALVLYAKGTWRKAHAALQKALRARARALGLEVLGPLHLVPVFLPQPGQSLPTPSTELEFRGELELR